MIKELIIKDTKDKLKFLINNTKEEYLKKLDKEEKEVIATIINKESYSLDDINDLLINHFSYELDNYELLQLIKTNSSKRKKINRNEKLLLYIIEYYLITKEEYETSIIEIINNISANDINEIDKYLYDKNYQDNDKILNIVNNIKLDNSLGKNIINDLKRIINLFKNNTINLELINSFLEEKIPKYNNYYYQFSEICKSLINIDTNNHEEIILLYLTFIPNIDLFKNIKINKDNLMDFIKKVEDKGFILNDNQINNLFDSFREKYYQDNNQKNAVTFLKNKVIEEYSKYYNKHFYFKIEEFIEYYNNLYNDDFSIFSFSKEFKKLNRNIFDSIFYNHSNNESVIVLQEELNQFNSFKIKILDYKINCLENEKTYYERYKFYLMYIDKVKEYFDYHESIIIEYYALKNIPDNHQGSFYELFRYYYGDSYKIIGRNGKAITNSCKLLKQEYLEELETHDFDKRYEILNKYKKYCLCLKCLSLLNEHHLLSLTKEYEEMYYNTKLPAKIKKKKHTK